MSHSTLRIGEVAASAAVSIQGMLCPSCDLRVLDMRTDKAAQAKAKQYGVKRVPAVVVNGKLAECCHGGVEGTTLRSLGVGVTI